MPKMSKKQGQQSSRAGRDGASCAAVIIEGPHWQTLYVGGVKRASEHKLSKQDLACADGITVARREQSPKHVLELFSLPDTLAEYEREERLVSDPEADYRSGKFAGVSYTDGG